jgi:hypothetical protein
MRAPQNGAIENQCIRQMAPPVDSYHSESCRPRICGVWCVLVSRIVRRLGVALGSRLVSRKWRRLVGVLVRRLVSRLCESSRRRLVSRIVRRL